VKRILVGTAGGLFEIDPGTGPEPDEQLSGRSVGALAEGGSALWAIADGRSVLRNDGDGWRDVARDHRSTLNCLLAADGMYVGTSEAHLRMLDGGDLRPVEGFDRIEGRDDWYTPWGGPPDTRSLSAGADGTLYANVHVGGIPRSSDGQAWEPTIDVHADVHQVLAHSARPGLVLAACAKGLAVTRDGGDTWEYLTEGLRATYSRAVAVAGDTVLVTASDSHRGTHAAVYRTADSLDRHFERCTAGLPDWFQDNIDTHCLAANGNVAAFGTADGSVYTSEDVGSTWAQVAADLPAVRCLVLR
jgi:hypothetical protein